MMHDNIKSEKRPCGNVFPTFILILFSAERTENKINEFMTCLYSILKKCKIILYCENIFHLHHLISDIQ